MTTNHDPEEYGRRALIGAAVPTAKGRGRRRAAGMAAAGRAVPAAGAATLLAAGLIFAPTGPAAAAAARVRSASQEGHLTVSSSGGEGPAAAPFYITLFNPARAAQVTDWATGKVLARLTPPGGGGFSGAAAGNDHTFVLAAGQTTSRYYEVHLSRSGAPGPLSRLRVPVSVPPFAPFAMSPSGRELAIAVQPHGSPAHGEMVVVSLATSKTRTWRSPDPGSVTWLSWTAQARLAFDWQDSSAHAGVAASRSGLRLLDTRAAGDDLLASRLLIAQSARLGSYRGVAYPLISADGSTVFDTMVSGAGGTDARAEVVQFAAATGHPVKAVSPVAGESGMGTWCGAVWTDPSGRHALAVCEKQGRIDNGRFTAVDLHFPVPGFSAAANFFGW